MWNRNEVAAFVVRARLAGHKVHEFREGYSIEAMGEQVFRATEQGNERYDVRINHKVFPDV